MLRRGFVLYRFGCGGCGCRRGGRFEGGRWRRVLNDCACDDEFVLGRGAFWGGSFADQGVEDGVL